MPVMRCCGYCATACRAKSCSCALCCQTENKANVALLTELRDALEVPIAAVISMASSIRKAVAHLFPDVAHQLCQFHYLREAAKLVFEADRHAKKDLKKRVRGIRPIERAVEDRDDRAAEIVRGYGNNRGYKQNGFVLIEDFFARK